MAQIRIDFDALRSEASKMGSMRGSYEALTGKLKSLSEQILSQWKGEASTAYGNKMADYHRQALIMIDILEKFKFDGQITTMANKGILYIVIPCYRGMPLLSPNRLTS